MKKPIKPKGIPRRPTEPKEPLKEYPYETNMEIHGEGLLKELLPEGVRFEDLYMEELNSYDGGYEIYYKVKGVRQNYHYESELEKYKKDKAAYTEKLQRYEQRKKEFESEIKAYTEAMIEYEKFITEEKIKKLQVELQELQK